MKDNLFTNYNNPAERALEVNLRAREHEKYFNSMEASWKADIKESQTQKQGENKISMTNLQTILSRISIKRLAPIAHSHS